MAGESPTDWLGFAEYLGLAGDEISRLDAEARQRAQGLETEASQRLAVAGQESMRTGQPLSRTGSYGDYLKAQQEAKKAQAAIGARTGNIYEDAAREAQGSQPDMGTGQRLATQEDAWRKRASAWASDMFKSRQAYAEAQKAKESAHQERLRSEAEQKRALGYAADDGEAYRKWSDEVNQSARRSGTGSIGAGAYYGGKPPRG